MLQYVHQLVTNLPSVSAVWCFADFVVYNDYIRVFFVVVAQKLHATAGNNADESTIKLSAV